MNTVNLSPRIERLLLILNELGFQDVTVNVKMQSNSVKISITMYDSLERLIKTQEVTLKPQ